MAAAEIRGRQVCSGALFIQGGCFTFFKREQPLGECKEVCELSGLEVWVWWRCMRSTDGVS